MKYNVTFADKLLIKSTKRRSSIVDIKAICKLHNTIHKKISIFKQLSRCRKQIRQSFFLQLNSTNEHFLGKHNLEKLFDFKAIFN